MGAPAPGLEKALRDCNGLLDEEDAAFDSKDLDALEEIQPRKADAIALLVAQIEKFGKSKAPEGDYLEKVRDVNDRIRKNGDRLKEWMETVDRDVALASRGRNRLKGVRRKYVTIHKGAYRKPGQSFEA
jgi:hypothetical protein